MLPLGLFADRARRAALLVALVMGAVLMAVAPSGVATLVSLAVTAVIFYWFLMATRLILGVSWPMAGLLLVVNCVPMMFISLIINRILEVTVVAL